MTRVPAFLFLRSLPMRGLCAVKINPACGGRSAGCVVRMEPARVPTNLCDARRNKKDGVGLTLGCIFHLRLDFFHDTEDFIHTIEAGIFLTCEDAIEV